MFRPKQKAGPASGGLYLDPNLIRPHRKNPQVDSSVRSGETLIRTGTDTFIIPGEGITSREKVTEFVGKTKKDYREAFDTLVGMIPQVNKKPVPKPLPQVSPFLDTPTAPTLQPQPPKTPTPPPKTPVPAPATKNFILPTLSLSHLPGEVEGRVVSVVFDEPKPATHTILASVFFVITFSYTTLTLLSFGLILALTITLNNAGTPGFAYLSYYPNVGLLPIVTCTATIIFMYIGYKLRDGSRLSWLLGISSLASIPVILTFVLPSMTYPLVRLVSVYAGTAKISLPPAIIDLSLLQNFFSLFLLFEAIIIFFIVFIRDFRFPSRPLSANAATSLLVMVFLFLIPISTVIGYGYFDAKNSDFGQALAISEADFHVYLPDESLSGLVNASRFISDEHLAGSTDAVSTSYDLPLPYLVKGTDSSKISVTQAKPAASFSLDSYFSANSALYDTAPQPVNVPVARDQFGYTAVKRGVTELWFFMPDGVLVRIASLTVPINELIKFSQTLK